MITELICVTTYNHGNSGGDKADVTAAGLGWLGSVSVRGISDIEVIAPKCCLGAERTQNRFEVCS